MLELLEEHAMPHQTPVGVFHASPTPVGINERQQQATVGWICSTKFLAVQR